MDFRAGKRLGDALACTDFHEIWTGGGVDHFFLVDGKGMREHAAIESKASGIALSCWSDAPGVLVYTGNGLEAEKGKGGSVYGKNFAVCLETERFPNGVNLPHWRDQVMQPANMPYESATEFVFAVKTAE
jgi:aldose 1-epimerase